MKLNISYPATGLQKVVTVDDEKQLATLYDKRLSQEISGDFLGDAYKGYIFRITGGHDKQGFTMKQGVLADHRVRLLLKGGPCYRPRRSGERRRKSVRGCIISHDISALALVVVKKGERELEGITDGTKPRRLGPKRASKIRKLFALSKHDDVRKYVVRRVIEPKEGKDTKRKKPRTKAPKIQRLVTPVTLKRKFHLRKVREDRMRHSKQLASAYAKLLAKRKLEASAKSRATKLASRLSRTSDGRPSKSSRTEKKTTATEKPVVEVKETKAKETTKETKGKAKAVETTKQAPPAKEVKSAAKEVKSAAKEVKSAAKEVKSAAKETKTTKEAKDTKSAGKDTKTTAKPAAKETKSDKPAKADKTPAPAPAPLAETKKAPAAKQTEAPKQTETKKTDAGKPKTETKKADAPKAAPAAAPKQADKPKKGGK